MRRRIFKKGPPSLEKGLALLVVLTLIAIAAERPILRTTMTLDADDGVVALYDDSSEGGQSRSKITDHRQMKWQCDLANGANFVFCGFELVLAPHRQHGVDLSNYDQIDIWLDYQGPTETIRVYLRNFDPEYSTPARNDSTKYNQVEFDSALARKDQPISLSMKDFFVANWWFQRYRIEPKLTHPQFDNIVVLEVQTGIDPRPGMHKFQLQKVELAGQIISSEQWYLGMLGAWVLAALLFLASRIWRLNRELVDKNRRERELLEVNRVLDERGQELEVRAKTDPLTGAWNRQGVEEALKEGLLAFRRSGEPLSLIFLDIDHFKAINDYHGHDIGDQVLAGVSQTVQSSIRPSDTLVRWGGEEFLLVCRNTPLDSAEALAEKLKQLLERQTFAKDISTTASFGVASLRLRESADQLFKRADDAVYRAKEQGRNRVEVSGSQGSL